jgi:uncharacterized metal-binding protein YceD (DUF177 family)
MTDDALPWTFKVSISEIPDPGLECNLVATAEERAALAAIADVAAISELEAAFDVGPPRLGRIHVTGHVRGVVSQTCVVTLDPLQNRVDEEVDVFFAPEQEAEAARLLTAESDDLAADPPEPIIDGKIDLGRLAAELFVLGIDPYPRKEGASFEPLIAPVDPSEHPFAALAGLKAKEERAKGKK